MIETAKTARKAAGSKNRASRRVPLSRIVAASLKQYAAISVEHDHGSDVLDGYIPGSGALDAVKNLDLGMRGGKHSRAISVTGPYGSGKSSMAVFLDALYAPDGSPEREKSHRLLCAVVPDLASSVHETRKALGAHKRGLFRCTAMAAREPVAATVVRALEGGARRYFGRRQNFDCAGALKKMRRGLDGGAVPGADAVVGVIRGMCAKAPVLVVIDEFGKNVEHSAERSGEGDLSLLRAMAELAEGQERIPLFVVTLQHMAFEEHAAEAPAAQRREWSKIQRRFDDVPFSNSPGRARLLAADALARSGSANRRERARYEKRIRAWSKMHAARARDAGLESDIDEDLLSSCYPLHPLVLEVLPEMCSRYGQNERTLLSFVAGGGTHTAARFIDEAVWDGRGELPAVGLDVLYDYFATGSALAHASPSNASRFTEISAMVHDAHGLSEAESRALKAVGVLNLMGRSGRLRASRSMVMYATGARSDEAVQSLVEKSILTYRQHADEYRIWNGSDADINSALDTARRRLAGEPLAYVLNAVVPLHPVVASGHSYRTGTFRVFESRFADPGEGVWAEPADARDGAVTYVTGKPGRPKRPPRRPVLAAKAGNLEPLREAAIEAASIRDVLDNRPEIAADWVARRELNERLADSESSMGLIFDAAFDGALWHSPKAGRPSKAVSAGDAASKACDKAYEEAPRVFNSIINRAVPSPQGAAAVNRLLAAMVDNAGAPNLGIKGWGPERGIYEAVLARTGIHGGMDNDLGLRPPDKLVTKLWRRMESVIKKRRGRVPVSDLYEEALAPPFGARAGIMPVLTAALILANRDTMALYEHGTYCPTVAVEVLERLAKNPGHFEIKHSGISRSKKLALEAMSRELGLEPGEVGVLRVASHLFKKFDALPNFTKKTGSLDGDATAVRDALAGAVEPDALLFKSLPEALGFGPVRGAGSGARLDEFAARLSKSIRMLDSAFGDMLGDLRGSLFDALETDRKDLSKQASALLRHVQNPSTTPFLNALAADALEDDDWIKYVGMCLTDAPPADWGDGDRRAFTEKLKKATGRFEHLRALYFAKMGVYDDHTFSVTITHSDGSFSHRVLNKPELKLDDLKKIPAMLSRIRRKKLLPADYRRLAAISLNRAM